jgi:hypothetical protein
MAKGLDHPKRAPAADVDDVPIWGLDHPLLRHRLESSVQRCQRSVNGRRGFDEATRVDEVPDTATMDDYSR